MKALVLGGGNQGYAMAWDLLRAPDIEEVSIADVDRHRLNHISTKLVNEKLRTVRLDATDRNALARRIRAVDIVTNALPWYWNEKVTRTAVSAGASIVDIGSPSAIYKLDKTAKAAGVSVVVNCGLDPGIDRVLISYGASKLDSVERVTVLCGGFPQKSVLPCPLSYKITWSIEGVIASYVDWDELFETPKHPRRVTILKDGKKIQVEKLSGLEKARFQEPIGECECVFTHSPLDVVENLGLKGVRECWSKTVRWPGHFEQFKTLIELGLTSTQPITVNGVRTTPRAFLIEQMSRTMRYRPGEGDVVVMRVFLKGLKSGKQMDVTFDLVDMYDNRAALTAMERTTGFPCSIVAQMIGRGKISEPGVHAPENVVPHREFLRALDERGIKVTESVRES